MSKWCSTQRPRDQKALVISTSIPKRRLTDVWKKWIMLQLMIDALSLIENKTKPVDLIVKLMFWLEICQRRLTKRNWIICSNNSVISNPVNSKFMPMAKAEDLDMFNLKLRMLPSKLSRIYTIQRLVRKQLRSWFTPRRMTERSKVTDILTYMFRIYHTKGSRLKI